MVPTPLSLGLTLCDLVLVEHRTMKASLIGTFTTFRGHEFPFTPLPFFVFAMLTGGQGDGVVSLSVTHTESDEEVYFLTRTMNFPDRLAEVRTVFRLAECIFPVPGVYLFTLLVDGEWVAHHRVRVLPVEEAE